MGAQRTEKTTRIAVCSFQGRVCPRFDAAPEILIFDTKSTEEELTEKLPVSQVPPEKIIDALVDKKVGVVISGGIQERFQEMFLKDNISVIWGVVGEVQEVIQAYLHGKLHSAMRIVPRLEKSVPLPGSREQAEFRGRRRR